jgi:hypothetical protein
MEDVRLEGAQIVPLPIRSFDSFHLSFYWKSLVGSDRIEETSAAYFPE